MYFLRAVKKALLLISLILLLIGYLLITLKVAAIDFIFNILSIALALGGLIAIIGYGFSKVDDSFRRNDLVYGVLFIASAIGIFLFKAKLRDLVMILVAAIIFISSVLKIQDYLDARKLKKKSFGIYMTAFLITIAFAILVFLDPFKDERSYWIAGIGLLYAGISDIVSNIALAVFQGGHEKELAKEKEKETAAVKEKPPVKEEEVYPKTRMERIDVDLPKNDPAKMSNDIRSSSDDTDPAPYSSTHSR